MVKPLGTDFDGFFNNIKSVYREASDSLTWSTALTCGGVLCVTWFCYKALVEPFMSPLRLMPGMSFGPVFGNMRRLLKGQAMESTIDMIKEYGPLVRYYFFFGRERVMVADPDIMKHIFVSNCKNYVKPESKMGMFRHLMGNGLVLSEGATHHAHKRLMSPAFNRNSLKAMIPTFARRVDRIISHWSQAISNAKQNTVEAEVQNDLCRTTLDIIGETAFSYDFNSFERHDHPVNKSFERILTGSGLSWKFIIPYYFKLPLPDVKELKSDIYTVNHAVEDIMHQKRKLLNQGLGEEKVSKDILGKMMLARDEDGNGMTNEELRDQVVTLMLAGHETTATGMAWCLLVMAQHPLIQERARQEAINVLPPNIDDIDSEHIEKLHYIDAVVKETLRMYPPIPLTLREAVEDDEIMGENTPVYFIPKGTIFLVSVGPMMRRPDLFDSPDEFMPKRFLNADVDHAALYRFLPFGIGPRMCLGYKFALMEMKTMLALFLRHVNFEEIPGMEFKRRLRTTMRPDPPLKLHVTKL